jgi:hypothetical protein
LRSIADRLRSILDRWNRPVELSARRVKAGQHDAPSRGHGCAPRAIGCVGEVGKWGDVTAARRRRAEAPETAELKERLQWDYGAGNGACIRAGACSQIGCGGVGTVERTRHRQPGRYGWPGAARRPCHRSWSGGGAGVRFSGSVPLRSGCPNQTATSNPVPRAVGASKIGHPNRHGCDRNAKEADSFRWFRSYHVRRASPRAPRYVDGRA